MSYYPFIVLYYFELHGIGFNLFQNCPTAGKRINYGYHARVFMFACVHSYGCLFNCTTLDQASDSTTTLALNFNNRLDGA